MKVSHPNAEAPHEISQDGVRHDMTQFCSKATEGCGICRNRSDTDGDDQFAIGATSCTRYPTVASDLEDNARPAEFADGLCYSFDNQSDTIATVPWRNEHDWRAGERI